MLEPVKQCQANNNSIADASRPVVIMSCIGSVAGVCGARQMLWKIAFLGDSVPQGGQFANANPSP